MLGKIRASSISLIPQKTKALVKSPFSVPFSVLANFNLLNDWLARIGMRNCNRGSRFTSINARIVLRYVFPTSQCSCMFLWPFTEAWSSVFLLNYSNCLWVLPFSGGVFYFFERHEDALYNAESPRPTNFTAVLWAYLDFYILQIKGRTMFRHANTVSFSSVSVFKYLWRMKLSSLHGCCKN